MKLWNWIKSWFATKPAPPVETPVILQHKHVLIEAKVRKCPSENDIDFMRDWFAKLVQDLGMKILSGPHIEYVWMKGNKGLTGVCIIETSHIALHCWEEADPSLIQLDVYTCGEMNLQTVFKALEPFDPVSGTFKYLDRENGFKELENGEINGPGN